MLEFLSLKINLAYAQPQSPDVVYHDIGMFVKTSLNSCSDKEHVPGKGTSESPFQKMNNLNKALYHFSAEEKFVCCQTVFYCCHDQLNSWPVVRENKKCYIHKHFWTSSESIACPNMCTLPRHPWEQKNTVKSKNF